MDGGYTGRCVVAERRISLHKKHKDMINSREYGEWKRRNKQPIRKVRVQKEGGEFAANFCKRLAADSTLSTQLRFVSGHFGPDVLRLCTFDTLVNYMYRCLNVVP